MTKCEYCGKEIGLLAVRYTWLDKQNNRAMHDECYEKYMNESQSAHIGIESEKKKKNEEKVIGMINGLNLPGLTDQRYNLLFADKRLIGQFVGSNTAGFLVGGLVGMAIADSLHKKKAMEMNKETDLEKILISHRNNFAIDYVDINEVQLKKKNMKIILNQKQEVVGKKPIFYFSKNQLDDIKSILMKVMPEKTTMK